MKVYLDNCCFNRPYDVQEQLSIKLETQAKLFIQHLVYEGHISLVWSYMLDYENSLNPFESKRIAIEKWKNLAIVNILETQTIINDAENIQKTGIKVQDALHIACAIDAKADYFITVDKRVLKYKDNRINIVDPVAMLKIVEG
jgi:predicted nucleic acid-binding protein